MIGPKTTEAVERLQRIYVASAVKHGLSAEEATRRTDAAVASLLDCAAMYGRARTAGKNHTALPGRVQ